GVAWPVRPPRFPFHRPAPAVLSGYPWLCNQSQGSDPTVLTIFPIATSARRSYNHPPLNPESNVQRLQSLRPRRRLPSGHTTAIDNISELIERLSNDEDAVRKMAVFKLQSSIGDPSFAEAFIAQGGLSELKTLCLTSNGNTLAYALTSLGRLLELDK